MIKLQTKLPKMLYLACSGGVDSMAALDFLSKKHKVFVLHFNHGTAHSDQAERFVVNYCKKNSISYEVGRLKETIPPGLSREQWWREKRYEFLDKYSEIWPIVTCHHLDDCVETWVWSSMHGTGKIIPYRRNNVIRPFRLTRKSAFKWWCVAHGVPWIEDTSNADTCYTRNYIRHEMMPHILRVNPGIHKTISKKINIEPLQN